MSPPRRPYRFQCILYFKLSPSPSLPLSLPVRTLSSVGEGAQGPHIRPAALVRPDHDRHRLQRQHGQTHGLWESRGSEDVQDRETRQQCRHLPHQGSCECHVTGMCSPLKCITYEQPVLWKALCSSVYRPSFSSFFLHKCVLFSCHVISHVIVMW